MASDPQDMAVLATQVVVCSESDPNVTYLVQLPYCPCKDFRYRRSNPEKYPDSPFCKHIRQAPAQSGPAPEQVTYHRLTRQRAVTLLSSAFLAADLANRLLLAACGADGICVTVRITNGDVLVKYDSEARRYTVTLPAAQPVELPANWPTELRG